MTTNPLIDFLKELVMRFSTKSPAFFKVIQWISGGLALAMYIPATLQAFGIDLPAIVSANINLVLAKCASVAFVVSMLTTQSKPIGITEDGKIIKSSNDEKLPFTSTSEQKIAIRSNVSEVEVKKT